MILPLRQVYEDAGYHVIGIAPTGRVVRELAEEAGVAAWTLDRALQGVTGTVAPLDNPKDQSPSGSLVQRRK